MIDERGRRMFNFCSDFYHQYVKMNVYTIGLVSEIDLTKKKAKYSTLWIVTKIENNNFRILRYYFIQNILLM